MAAATLTKSDGAVVHMPRVILLTPTSVTYTDVCGQTHRESWSPVYDRLEYKSAEAIIASLESALARATGQSLATVRLQFGYDGHEAAA